MRSLTKSLVLIVWNEKAGCEADVPLLPIQDFDEVFAIDGGSTDGTVEFLESQAIKVYPQGAKSLNAAYYDAVERSSCDAVVVFFPKGTIDPVIVSGLAHRIDIGFDLVVASRNMVGAHNEEDEQILKPRKWGVAALSYFTSFLWRREGWRIRDVLHGVKAFTVDAYKMMNISKSGVSIDLEMVVRSYRNRIPRTEFPVVEQARIEGQTHFKIWPTGKRLAKFLWRELFKNRP